VTGWRERAACKDTWFPEAWWLSKPGDKTESSFDDNQAARRVCRRCPVVSECAQDALVMRADGVIRAAVACRIDRRGEWLPASEAALRVAAGYDVEEVAA